MKINQISPLDHIFTSQLDGIALMPKTLYYYGELPSTPVSTPVATRSTRTKTKAPAPDRLRRVAIIGARKNTSYGAEIAFQIAKQLAERGVVIISGLALGIDSIAHRGALAARDGRTVAVLGTAINQIHPRAHADLAREIVERGGAVLSEYPSGTPFYPARFLERNRLISGLADAVSVVEANLHSGSLNTAAHAVNQGRELFAVPGDLTRPLSAGTNQLLAQGAHPYTGLDDFLKLVYPELLPKPTKKTARTTSEATPTGDTPAETTILRLLASGLRDGEELLARAATELAGFDASLFNQTITLLEIKGTVRSLGANRWSLT